MLGSLENKLLQQNYQRERAEQRCGETLKEMEDMQEDLKKLYNELQESEQRCYHLMEVMRDHERQVEEIDKKRHVPPTPEPPSPVHQPTPVPLPPPGPTQKEYNRLERKYKEIEKQNRSKDEKIKGYREIIVRLKEEFIKSEEEKAAWEVQNKYRQEERSANGPSNSGISSEELRDLKEKLSNLHEGLRNAKQDLEKAKKGKEKVQQEKEGLAEDLKKQEESLRKTEQQLHSATNMMQKYRKELEESKRKETRLREKLKEFIAQGSAQNGEGGGGPVDTKMAPKTLKEAYTKFKAKSEELDRENELLRAQIAAYKNAETVNQLIEADLKAIGFEMALKNRGEREVSVDGPRAAYGTNATAGTGNASGTEDSAGGHKRGPTGGFILGTREGSTGRERDRSGERDKDSHAAPPIPTGNTAVDELRQQLHHKWENEKKLQKRNIILETRLKELTEECDDLRHQVIRAKDSMTGALTAKEEMQKRLAAHTGGGGGGGHHSGGGKKPAAVELNELSEVITVILCLVMYPVTDTLSVYDSIPIGSI